MRSLSLENIISALRSIGISHVAYLTADKVYEMLRAEREYFEDWQRNGCAGEMQYMLRNAELFFEPKNILKDFKSLIVCFIPYIIDNMERNTEFSVGKIARYAMFADYHKVIKDALTEVMQNILSNYLSQGDNVKYRVFADALPFLEKIAGRALGVVGKNTLLRVANYGSFGFLAEIFLNIECSDVEDNQISFPAPCGSCTRCLDACPTDALVDGKYLDAKKCISYLTIEKRSAWTVEETHSVGDCLFGCDKCQEVCPHNVELLSRFSQSSSNLFTNKQVLPQFIDLREILGLKDDAEFKEKFGGTVFERIGRERLIRNARAIVANKSR